jgi:uncharacterized protein (DUF111 family)
MEHKERMVHFDVSLGCTAQTLIGALADLNGNIDCVQRAFEAHGLAGVEVALRLEKSKTSTATVVDFGTFSPSPSNQFPLPKRGVNRRPFWARSKKPSVEKINPEPESESPVSAWQRNEPVTLVEIKQVLEEGHLKPIPQALALKVVNTLIQSLEKATGASAATSQLPGVECARILCQIIAFSELITELNPSAITATRVAMSFSDQDTDKRGWLLVLAEEIPTLDRNWPAPYSDCVGLAFLKTVVSRFGARGESVIETHGIGADSSNTHPHVTTRALRCHLPHIASRTDTTNTLQEAMPQVEVTAILGHGIDISDLLRRLHALGMRSVLTWQAFEGSTFPRVMLRGVISHAEVQTAVEAILVTGEATELSTHFIETQSLQQRTVSVPFGRGQKLKACRVNEWLWSGKVLRADPDANDLSQLVQSTGYAQDVLRADVLAAWRKWRQPSA